MTSELAVFKQEYMNNLYRVDTYFLAKTIAEFPIFCVMPILFISIEYPMIGLRRGIFHFLKAALTVLLTSDCALSIGYLLSCLAPSINAALGIAPIIIIPLMLFGGFLMQVEYVFPLLFMIAVRL
jgi:ABC-type multidrug transport system permease subunit